MKLREKINRKITRLILAKIDYNSLQIRLVLGIIIILIVELVGLGFCVSCQMKQLLNSTYTQQNITDDYTNFSTIINSLRNMSILWLVITIILMTLFVHKILIPLQKMNHWAIADANYEFNLNCLPTEVKSIANKLNIISNRLQSIKEQQQQFINDFAHEFRTPLSMVYGYLQRTQQRSHNLTDAQKETLEMAISDAERMINILQDSLNLARANSTISLSAEPLVINNLLIEMAQMTEKFQHRSIELDMTPLLVKVRADKNQLMQVFQHLINNAVKYSDIDKPISIQLTETDGLAVIQVRDRGCGIPLSEQARIFEPFYRADSSRARTTGGTGLGLSIVKRLVEDMGGSVAVRSEPSFGSTFIVTLPTLGAKK